MSQEHYPKSRQRDQQPGGLIRGAGPSRRSEYGAAHRATPGDRTQGHDETATDARVKPYGAVSSREMVASLLLICLILSGALAVAQDRMSRERRNRAGKSFVPPPLDVSKRSVIVELSERDVDALGQVRQSEKRLAGPFDGLKQVHLQPMIDHDLLSVLSFTTNSSSATVNIDWDHPQRGPVTLALLWLKDKSVFWTGKPFDAGEMRAGYALLERTLWSSLIELAGDSDGVARLQLGTPKTFPLRLTQSGKSVDLPPAPGEPTMQLRGECSGYGWTVAADAENSLSFTSGGYVISLAYNPEKHRIKAKGRSETVIALWETNKELKKAEDDKRRLERSSQPPYSDFRRIDAKFTWYKQK